MEDNKDKNTDWVDEWVFEELETPKKDKVDNEFDVEDIIEKEESDAIIELTDKPISGETNEEYSKKMLAKMKKKPKQIIKEFDKTKKNVDFNNEKNVRCVTDKDYEARIYLWMLEGWTNKKICDQLQNNYGIPTLKKAKRLVNNVNRSYRIIDQKEAEELKSRYLEMYSDLYRRALNKDDLSTARNILDSVTKLQGLATKKVDKNVNNTFNVDFN